MSQSDYGAYSVSFSIFLLLSSVHNVLIIEPLNIFGASKYRSDEVRYLKINYKIHWCLTLLSGGLSLVFGLVSFFFYDNAVFSFAFVGLGLSQGMILYYWLARRTCYLFGKAKIAAAGSAFYGLFLVGGVFTLKYLTLLSPFALYLLMGIVSIIAGLWVKGHFIYRKNDHCQKEEIGKIVNENWNYGKWLIIASLFSWGTSGLYQVLTGGMLGLTEAGALRAMQNLSSPIIQVTTAMGVLFMPMLSRAYADKGRVELVNGIIKYCLIGAGCAVSYALLMLFFRTKVVAVFYGNLYLEYSWLLPLYCLVPVVTALSSGWSTGLRITGNSKRVLYLDALGVILTLTLGVFLLHRFNIYGAVFGVLVSYSSRLLVMPIIWWRYVA